jgi:tetratricopeptide (TPR) repeat protein
MWCIIADRESGQFTVVRNPTHSFPAWALWIMGVVTLLAAALLILAIVLGVQAGQRQLEIQQRQEAAIALAGAIDDQAGGDFAAALDGYKHVLQLDADNAAAREGIEQVLAAMAGNPAMAAINPTPAPAAVNSAPAAANPTSTPGAETGQMLQSARTAFEAGRWQEAVSYLVTIKQSDVTFQLDEVNTLLFDAYVNLAAEKDNEDNLEEALLLFDEALELRPDAVQVSTERKLIANYLDVLTYFGADWPRAIELLEELYAQEPTYRDVASRLQEALVGYGDMLVSQGEWCVAAEQFTAAINLAVTPGLIAKRDETQQHCDNGDPVAVAGSTTATATLAAGTVTPGTTPVAAATTGTEEPTATPTEALAAALAGAPTRGQLFYSARDTTTGRNRILLQPIGGTATVVQENASQPALRPDGQRLVFRNLRDDMFGLGALDPTTGLLLRFTTYAEDSVPSWNPEGNRLVFASNREGDRLWRIYVTWAESDADTLNLGFGETPSWNPTLDQIVFRGCDTTGNACGLWLINSSGGDRGPLTSVQADTRPTWAPTGRYVAFMSDGRDGNMEIYRADVTSGQVVRLTDNPSMDALPAISPDSRWVAFASNRDGAWKIWAAPINGGDATLLLPVNGDLGNWVDQGIEWVE